METSTKSMEAKMYRILVVRSASQDLKTARNIPTAIRKSSTFHNHVHTVVRLRSRPSGIQPLTFVKTEDLKGVCLMT